MPGSGSAALSLDDTRKVVGRCVNSDLLRVLFTSKSVQEDRRAQTIEAALKRFLKAFDHTVHTILTGSGLAFLDRFGRGAHLGGAAGTTGEQPANQWHGPAL